MDLNNFTKYAKITMSASEADQLKIKVVLIMKIKGYTLHGDYYLADEVITCTNWKEACEMKEIITLPNGKAVIAHTLSKEELKTIPKEERKCGQWYWSCTPSADSYAWDVDDDGVFSYYSINGSIDYGGARLGFKNPF